MLLHVVDRAEIDFPFTRPTLFRGLESHPGMLADPRSLRQAYREQFQLFLDALKQGARQCGADYYLMPTDRPFDEALRTCLASRMGRVG